MKKITLIKHYIRKNILFPIRISKSKFQVMSDAETIDYIINNRASVSRFGDGELQLIKGLSIGFQEKNQKLAKALESVLADNSQSTHLNCINRCMFDLEGLTPIAKYAWIEHVARNGFPKVLDKSIKYGNTGFSRFYIDYADKNKQIMQGRIDKIKEIWEDKDVYIVEGRLTRSGVNNDLFSNAKSLKRIICPSHDAYEVYGKILDNIKRNVDDKENALLLLMLGPTATVLAYDLHKAGFWAVDIGHVDIEYEWFLNGSANKTLISGKYVNEAGGIRDNNIPQQEMDKYNSEIICEIDI